MEELIKEKSVTDVKIGDFYFLYLKKNSEMGITQHTWHEHPFDEIMYIAQGESEYAVEDKRYVIKKGDVLLIKAGYHHFERSVMKTPTELFCLGFSPFEISCPDIEKKLFNLGEHFSIGDSYHVEKMLFAAKEKLAMNKDNAELFIKAIVEAILLMLYDLDMTRRPSEKSENENFRKIIHFINENLSSIKTIDDIANATFFSNSYVRAIFKREMGIGVMEYVRNKKALLANKKISAGKKPTEIYAECGFANYTSFYRAYTAYFGNSPRRKP